MAGWSQMEGCTYVTVVISRALVTKFTGVLLSNSVQVAGCAQVADRLQTAKKLCISTSALFMWQTMLTLHTVLKWQDVLK